MPEKEEEQGEVVAGVRFPREPEINIQNVVSSADIRQKLNLKEIAQKIKESRYEPNKFPGLVLKLKDPKAA